jgi:hypothetical protein
MVDKSVNLSMTLQFLWTLAAFLVRTYCTGSIPKKNDDKLVFAQWLIIGTRTCITGKKSDTLLLAWYAFGAHMEILFYYGSTALCWALAAFQFLNLCTASRTPWTGPLSTHRTTQTQNKRRQISIPRMGFEPTIPAFQRAKTVHALDRAATEMGNGW